MQSHANRVCRKFWPDRQLDEQQHRRRRLYHSLCTTNEGKKMIPKTKEWHHMVR